MTSRASTTEHHSRIRPGWIGAIVGISLLIAGLIAVSGSARVAQSSPTRGLDVLPFPGTPDASARTQIDFPKLAPSQLRTVTVTGSRSGRDGGRLVRLRPGGTAFVPARQFLRGEQVSVRATLRSASAGAASGAPNTSTVTFQFTVASPATISAAAAASGDIASPAAVHSTLAHAALGPSTFTHSFHSAPWLHPPVVVVGNKDPDTRSGDIFLDAQRSFQAGPLILDAQGRPVWFDPLSSGQSGFNLSVQSYAGRSVLTFWQGSVNGGWGQGNDVLLNHYYQTLATVNAANGYKADLHEFQITPQGNALITIFSPVHADLSSVGGPKNGILLDSIMQEINIATGHLVWEWHAYGHVHIAESYAGTPNGNPYDFFHINSVQQLSNGNFLVSARHTFAVYEINPSTGKIVWVLGGKHSSFTMGPGTNFEWQHDARMQPDGSVTLFNDADGYRKSESQSRGMRISLNFTTRTASLARSYTHSPPVLSVSEGNLQVLPNNNVFVGFGATPDFTEYSSGGRQEFTARFIYPVEFYRAYRFPWWGKPTGQPSIAAAATKSGTTVYASWDGATEIATWRVFAGPTPSSLQPVAQRGWAGFETGIPTSSTAAYFQVQAIGSAGKVLGSSSIVAR